MQSEKKTTKYVKAKDYSDQQRRALINLIKVALAEHKEVVDLAEALLMHNLNTSLSVEMLLNLLEGEPAKFNAEVDLGCELCQWLRKAINTKGKIGYKTPQTQKSRARTFSGYGFRRKQR